RLLSNRSLPDACRNHQHGQAKCQRGKQRQLRPESARPAHGREHWQSQTDVVVGVIGLDVVDRGLDADLAPPGVRLVAVAGPTATRQRTLSRIEAAFSAPLACAVCAAGEGSFHAPKVTALPGPSRLVDKTKRNFYNHLRPLPSTWIDRPGDGHPHSSRVESLS